MSRHGTTYTRGPDWGRSSQEDCLSCEFEQILMMSSYLKKCCIFFVLRIVKKFTDTQNTTEGGLFLFKKSRGTK